WERRRQPSFGITQYRLLGAIDESRRAPRVVKRLQELHRKFGDKGLASPQGLEGGMVESPIAADAVRKMTDAQWRRAIAKYATGYREARLRGDRDFLKGGASELAHELEGVTKEDPERFARLALSLTDDVNPAYLDAILRGIGAAPIPVGIDLTTTLV